MIDNIFKKPIKKQFEFDEKTAIVFDDMIYRSIPYYEDILDLSTNFSLKYLKNNDKVYDLGCSTGNTLINLYKKSNIKLNLIGIDNSKSMLEIAKKKSQAYNLDIKFINNDISNMILDKSKVIISNYTLQFIRPLQREKLIKKIYNSLRDDGIFIFSEKIILENKRLNKEFIDEYHNFKLLKGYTKSEITQKREALENILIPYTQNENQNMIINAGFNECEIVFKYLNFATFIAKK
jgi:tRNA (cmo5U34)-methyltransferase